jgi:hypothetical protein
MFGVVLGVASLVGMSAIIQGMENGLRESMIASEVNAVLGIVNGTTNFMLTKMAEGADYATVLAEAQRLGYAEADPTEDVTGGDAAAKVAILASIAFHTEVTIDDVPHEGIDTLDSVDVAFADDLGYSVKLIGQARRAEAGVRKHAAVRQRAGIGNHLAADFRCPHLRARWSAPEHRPRGHGRADPLRGRRRRGGAAAIPAGPQYHPGPEL